MIIAFCSKKRHYSQSWFTDCHCHIAILRPKKCHKNYNYKNSTIRHNVQPQQILIKFFLSHFRAIKPLGIAEEKEERQKQRFLQQQIIRKEKKQHRKTNQIMWLTVGILGRILLTARELWGCRGKQEVSCPREPRPRLMSARRDRAALAKQGKYHIPFVRWTIIAPIRCIR